VVAFQEKITHSYTVKIVFRTDASHDIGTGHIMRCLTLADELRERGAHSHFICRDHPGNLSDLIGKRGYPLHVLPDARQQIIKCEACSKPASDYRAWLGVDWDVDAQQTLSMLDSSPVDWLIVDHYALDILWEQALRAHCKKLLVIDDLADRRHDCDLLLDQNLGRQDQDYFGLISHKTQTLIGPVYALLRPEFAEWRQHSLQRRAQPQLKNLLITMGGVDQANVTGQVLDALTHCELPTDLSITVVMGLTATWLPEVQAQAVTIPRPTQVLVGVSNMAQLMAESDLCIGAAGGTAWERCVLGLPTLILILSANQYSSAMALQSYDAAWVVADMQQLKAQMSALFNKNTQTATLQKMSQAAAKLANGTGASQVVELLLALHV